MMNMSQYNVRLTDEERGEPLKLIQKGGKGYRVKHAQILLKLDKVPENAGWTYERIGAAYSATDATIASTAKRFVFEGLEAALGRKTQENRRRKITGEIEARLVAIACSEPPEGRSRWTTRMIADELIRLKIVEYISDSGVCQTLKKNEIKPWLVKELRVR
jgi:transposase